MKIYLLILLLSFSLIGSCQFPEPTKQVLKYGNKFLKIGSKPITNIKEIIPIIIVTGQSNAVATVANKGSGLTSYPLEYQTIQDSLMISYEGNYLTYDTNNTYFATYTPNINTSSYNYSDPANAAYNIGNMAIELKCGDLLKDYYGKKVYIIKAARGSQGIIEWDNGNIMWVELERKIRKAIQQIKANGSTPLVLSIGFMQGEQDATNGTYHYYGSKLRALIVKMRAMSTEMNNTQFVMFRLSSVSGNPSIGMNYVNAVFDSIATENPTINKTINTDSQTFWSQPHYDANSIINMGGLWYNVIDKIY